MLWVITSSPGYRKPKLSYCLAFTWSSRGSKLQHGEAWYGFAYCSTRKIWLSQLNAGPAMRNREGLTPYKVATQSRCFAASIALLWTSRAGRPDLSVAQVSLYYDADFDGSKKSACNMTAAPQQVTTAIRPLHASILQDCFTPVLQPRSGDCFVCIHLRCVQSAPPRISRPEKNCRLWHLESQRWGGRLATLNVTILSVCVKAFVCKSVVCKSVCVQSVCV